MTEETKIITLLDTFFRLENLTIDPFQVKALYLNGSRLEIFTYFREAPIAVPYRGSLEEATQLLALAFENKWVFDEAQARELAKRETESVRSERSTSGTDRDTTVQEFSAD